SPSRDGSAGYVDVEAGSHSRARLRGALNVPLERAPIAIRIAGAMASRDGYMHNTLSGSDSNDEGFDALRVKMLYEPSDTLSLVLAAERRTEDSSRATSTKPMPLLGVNGGIEMGGIVPEDPRATTENVAPAISGEAERYSAQVRWTGETTTLLATSAYVHSGVRLSLDLD